MNNIKDLFGDVKTDLGMLGLLSEKQLDIFRSEVEAAMERGELSCRNLLEERNWCRVLCSSAKPRTRDGTNQRFESVATKVHAHSPYRSWSERYWALESGGASTDNGCFVIERTPNTITHHQHGLEELQSKKESWVPANTTWSSRRWVNFTLRGIGSGFWLGLV